MPWATRHLDARGYDLVLSSDAAVVKGVRTDPGQLHVCYCHSPPRYAWGMLDAYLGDASLPVRGAAAATMAGIRRFDRRAAARVTDFVANSANVADRIRRFYGRDSTVIHPPVDVERFKPGGAVGDHYLVAGQLVSYKRADVAVQAFAGLGRELRVVGDGPTMAALRDLAPPNVRFLGRTDDATWVREMASCRALIFPGEEDFGIVPLEAMACGRPVIALGRGGALETVIGPLADEVDGTSLPHGATGLFVRGHHPRDLADAVRVFERVQASISTAACRARAEQFAEPRFRSAIAEYLEQAVGDHAQATR
jgi:glycosyltransferase involved in cell wall biosynthesis